VTVAIERLDHVSVVVDDLAAAIAGIMVALAGELF